MSAPRYTTVNVRYRFIDGYHVFTSDDVSGLYIAHRDQRKAFDGVCRSIEKLVKKNENIDISVEPAISFREFVAQTRNPLQQQVSAMSNREFILRAA